MERPAPTDAPIHDLLARRWSPRSFADRAVARPVLHRLFEAARWAPSSYNDQPWAFLVATRDGPDAFERVLGCLIDFNRSWASRAPALALTFARGAFTHNGQPNAHAWHDLGQAVAALTVQATAEGLAVHQMAGIVPERALAAFAVPEGWSPVTALAVGYPGPPELLQGSLRQRELAPRQRHPQSGFVFSEDWGRPADLGAGGV